MFMIVLFVFVMCFVCRLFSAETGDMFGVYRESDFNIERCGEAALAAGVSSGVDRTTFRRYYPFYAEYMKLPEEQQQQILVKDYKLSVGVEEVSKMLKKSGKCKPKQTLTHTTQTTHTVARKDTGGKAPRHTAPPPASPTESDDSDGSIIY